MKLSQTEGARAAIPQATETTRLARRQATARSLRIGALVAGATLLTACGPHGGPWDGNESDDGYPSPGESGGTESVGGAPAGIGGSAAGGSTYECDPQPQQTYVCAGTGFESELGGAAELIVYPDVCGEQYGSGGGWSVGGSPSGGGGGYYYGTGGYYVPSGGAEAYGGAVAVGGATSAGGAAIAAGGAIPAGDAPYAPAEDAYPGDSIGYGGEYSGTGGYDWGVGGGLYYPSGGQTGAGGGGSVDPKQWCNVDPAGTVVGGISFAVGSCQDVDVALPLLLTEPYYGSYTAHIYGSSSACDRAVLLSTVAGIGTGQVLEIPLRTEGYSFISVEVLGERFSEFGVRLRDRPRVVPSSGK